MQMIYISLCEDDKKILTAAEFQNVIWRQMKIKKKKSHHWKRRQNTDRLRQIKKVGDSETASEGNSDLHYGKTWETIDKGRQNIREKKIKAVKPVWNQF